MSYQKKKLILEKKIRTAKLQTQAFGALLGPDNENTKVANDTLKKLYSNNKNYEDELMIDKGIQDYDRYHSEMFVFAHNPAFWEQVDKQHKQSELKDQYAAFLLGTFDKTKRPNFKEKHMEPEGVQSKLVINDGNLMVEQINLQKARQGITNRAEPDVDVNQLESGKGLPLTASHQSLDKQINGKKQEIITDDIDDGEQFKSDIIQTNNILESSNFTTPKKGEQVEDTTNKIQTSNDEIYLDVLGKQYKAFNPDETQESIATNDPRRFEQQEPPQPEEEEKQPNILAQEDDDGFNVDPEQNVGPEFNQFEDFNESKIQPDEQEFQFDQTMKTFNQDDSKIDDIFSNVQNNLVNKMQQKDYKFTQDDTVTNPINQNIGLGQNIQNIYKQSAQYETAQNNFDERNNFDEFKNRKPLTPQQLAETQIEHEERLTGLQDGDKFIRSNEIDQSMASTLLEESKRDINDFQQPTTTYNRNERLEQITKNMEFFNKFQQNAFNGVEIDQSMMDQSMEEYFSTKDLQQMESEQLQAKIDDITKQIQLRKKEKEYQDLNESQQSKLLQEQTKTLKQSKLQNNIQEAFFNVNNFEKEKMREENKKDFEEKKLQAEFEDKITKENLKNTKAKLDIEKDAKFLKIQEEQEKQKIKEKQTKIDIELQNLQLKQEQFQHQVSKDTISNIQQKNEWELKQRKEETELKKQQKLLEDQVETQKQSNQLKRMQDQLDSFKLDQKIEIAKMDGNEKQKIITETKEQMERAQQAYVQQQINSNKLQSDLIRSNLGDQSRLFENFLFEKNDYISSQINQIKGQGTTQQQPVIQQPIQQPTQQNEEKKQQPTQIDDRNSLNQQLLNNINGQTQQKPQQQQTTLNQILFDRTDFTQRKAAENINKGTNQFETNFSDVTPEQTAIRITEINDSDLPLSDKRQLVVQLKQDADEMKKKFDDNVRDLLFQQDQMIGSLTNKIRMTVNREDKTKTKFDDKLLKFNYEQQADDMANLIGNTNNIIDMDKYNKYIESRNQLATYDKDFFTKYGVEDRMIQKLYKEHNQMIFLKGENFFKQNQQLINENLQKIDKEVETGINEIGLRPFLNQVGLPENTFEIINQQEGKGSQGVMQQIIASFMKRQENESKAILNNQESERVRQFQLEKEGLIRDLQQQKQDSQRDKLLQQKLLNDVQNQGQVQGGQKRSGGLPSKIPAGGQRQFINNQERVNSNLNKFVQQRMLQNSQLGKQIQVSNKLKNRRRRKQFRKLKNVVYTKLVGSLIQKRQKK